MQAGPASQDNEVFRAANKLLKDESFVTAQLNLIVQHQLRLEGDFSQRNTLFLFVMLALKVLSLTQVISLKEKALAVIESLRELAYNGMRHFEKKLFKVKDGTSFKAAEDLLRWAFLTRSTFDMDYRLPLNSDRSLEIFLRCAVIITQYTQTYSTNLSSDIRCLMVRDARMAWKLSDRLVYITQINSERMSKAMRTLLPNCIFSNRWENHKAIKSTWIYTTAKCERCSCTVEFDTLSGTLLVTGRQIGSLPQRYRDTTTYRALFGDVQVQVMKSDYMEYKTLEVLDGSILYFCLINNELIVRSGPSNGNTSDMTEYIPSQYFKEDLPQPFRNKTAAWLALGTFDLHFRPWNDRWNSSATEWTLTLSKAGDSVLRHRSDKILHTISSKIGQKYAKPLLAIEDSTFITMTSKDGTYNFELPRFSLSFTVSRDSNLECSELQAVVDADQHIGTFIGLKSCLVLRSSDKQSKAQMRTILVPHGTVAVRKVPLHVEVDIILAEKEMKVEFFRFQIDDRLQCIQCPADYRPMLFKALLHAVTSGILPDPLTGRNGTEEALACLHQQRINPSSPISRDMIPLLQQISDFTPTRTYYPTHLKKMQRVEWNENLSPSAQHDEFRIVIAKIIDRSNKLRSILPGNIEPIAIEDDGNGEMQERARIHNSSLYQDQYGGTIAPKDNPYSSKGIGDWSEEGQNCLKTVHLLNSSPKKVFLPAGATLREIFERWRKSQHAHVFLTLEESLSKLSRAFTSDLIKFPLEANWLGIYERLRKADPPKKGHFIKFLLGPIAYGSRNFDDMRVLVGIATSGKFVTIDPPDSLSLDRNYGETPDEADMCRVVRQHCLNLGQFHNRRLELQIRLFVGRVLEQYPCKEPQMPRHSNPRESWGFIPDLQGALRECKFYFEKCFANRLFGTHVRHVDEVLRSEVRTRFNEQEKPVLRNMATTCLRERDYKPHPTIYSYFRGDPKSQSSKNAVLRPPVFCLSKGASEVKELACKGELLKIMENPQLWKNTTTRTQYKSDLQESLQGFEKLPNEAIPQSIPENASEEIEKSRENWAPYFNSLSDLIRAAGIKDNEHSYLYPSIDPRTALGLLASSCPDKISDAWKKIILEYAISITMLQRLDRLTASVNANNTCAFYKEAQNKGHSNWDPSTIPDWVLLEIENNILIREDQVIFARAMARPGLDNNMIMQFDMGSGKTSCVIPMAILLLHQTNQEGKDPSLIRIIVTKSLHGSMLSHLKKTLGGIINRAVYCTPFSRDNPTTPGAMDTFDSICSHCQKSGGVIVATPEDLLSFKLLGYEEVINGSPENGSWMMGRYKYWQDNSRNIIDEADIILDPKFQLVYTLGNKTTFGGGVDRWIIPQQLLGLLARSILRVKDSKSITIESVDQGCFPKITLNKGKLGNELVDLLLGGIANGDIAGVDFRNMSYKHKTAVQHFIQDRELSQEDSQFVRSAFQDNETLMGRIYLLRGLIAHGILENALSEQWMLQYGPDPKRMILAVPYIGKGVPKTTAEFAHPDKSILLTYLSHYYGGLTYAQFEEAIQYVLREPDPEAEISIWKKSASINLTAASLRQIASARKTGKSEELFSQLRRNKSVIDFYLGNLLFPQACKEHSAKLSCSAWDILNRSPANTTGFTGTMDNSSLLPSTIKQEVIPGFGHTTAKQISLLLRLENSCYTPMGQDCVTTSLKKLLDLVVQQSPTTRVLIDVGAQIPEHTNAEVAKEWLGLVLDAEAALYFDQSDEARIIFRDNSTQLLVRSKYYGNLDNCLVYYDEIHTRGVDLKLPPNSRAAVTLGRKLPRDKLMQANMRMRGLGNGQSVMFISPPETAEEVREFSCATGQLSSIHVVQWSIENTLLAIEDTSKLQLSQGRLYRERQVAESAFLERYSKCATPKEKQKLIKSFAESVIVRTSTSLEEMYSGNASQGPALDIHVEVETELELETELQQEVQVQRPRKETAFTHALHPDVGKLILTGKFEENGGAFATHDFERTVNSSGEYSQERYMRPVQWVLSTVAPKAGLVLLSPFECEELLDEIATSKTVILHNWIPKTTKNPISLGDPLGRPAFGSAKSQINISESLRFELLIFSGQLYLDSMAQYRNFEIFLKGFLQDKYDRTDEIAQERRKDFLRAVLEIRNESVDISKSHMGRICQGRELKADDFEGETSNLEDADAKPPTKKLKK